MRDGLSDLYASQSRDAGPSSGASGFGLALLGSGMLEQKRLTDAGECLAEQVEAQPLRPVRRPGVVGRQTEIERASYLGCAWIPWEEIAHLGGLDKPDVVSVLRRLEPGGPWRAS